MKNILYWFTHDLRVNDNPVLKYLENADTLLCTYCLEESWFSKQAFQVPGISSVRLDTLKDALFDLSQSLRDLKQELVIEFGARHSVLSELIEQNQISHLLCSRQFGWYERQILSLLQQRFPSLVIQEVDNYTLFKVHELPMSIPDIPNTFSQFRKQLPQIESSALSLVPSHLPAMPSGFKPTNTHISLQMLAELQAPDGRYKLIASSKVHVGGEREGLKHLKNYFSSTAPSNYKETRNQLEGHNFSSKMSVFLSQGSISALKVVQSIRHYERTQVKNESTKWLYMELLWREYFQWLALKAGPNLFKFKGTAKSKPLTSFYPERFKKWCAGETPYKLVNACMKELSETGYLSNRGRQIVASCLINELGVDWRYGAAWFKSQLSDYDVSVNWGNWQYIAGVGADPRGGRHFNLEKQTQIYDPQGEYQKKWVGDQNILPIDSQDYVGWPIS